jgi:ParB/RepB/Spo0J family partition protein
MPRGKNDKRAESSASQQGQPTPAAPTYTPSANVGDSALGVGAPFSVMDGERFIAEMDHIAPNPMNLREDWEWETDEFEEFVANIDNLDVIQDPTVIARKVFLDKYPASADELPEQCRWVLGTGERRWRAALRLGRTKLVVVLRNVTAEALNDVLYSENQARKGLDPIQEAVLFQRYVDEGLTYRDIAARLGKKDNDLRISDISKRLRLLKLSDGPVRRAIRTGALGVEPAYLLMTTFGDDQDKVEHAYTVMVDEGITAKTFVARLAPDERPAKKRASKRPEGGSEKIPAQASTPNSKPLVSSTKHEDRDNGSGTPGHPDQDDRTAAREEACQLILVSREYPKPDDVTVRLAVAVITQAPPSALDLAHSMLHAAGTLDGTWDGRRAALSAGSTDPVLLIRAADAVLLAASELRARDASQSMGADHAAYLDTLVREAGYEPSPREADYVTGVSSTKH